MKKIEENVLFYLVGKMVEEAEKYEQSEPRTYHQTYDGESFCFRFNDNNKKIEILRIVEREKSYRWIELGYIFNDYSARCHLPFADQMFNLALKGITNEANYNNLEAELPAKEAPKTKRLKI